MSNFDTIKQQWIERETPQPSDIEFNSILDKTKNLRKKQQIGQLVLGLSSVILIVFFFYISAYKNTKVLLGLGIMISSLLIRISLEFFSMIKKEKLPANTDMKTYTQSLIGFYKRRRYLHFIVTPILFASYILGFIMLLPSFKQEFSSGFYTYIVISSWFIFLALAILIGFQIRKELRVLKEMIEIG